MVRFRNIAATLTRVSMSSAFLCCSGSSVTVRAPVVAGPPTGTPGVWTALQPQALLAMSAENAVEMHAINDRLYVLSQGVLYRSDDHGAHFSERGRQRLSSFAPFQQTLFGWGENQLAPLYLSRDDGLTFGGRPTETYSGDQLINTGAVRTPLWLRAFSRDVFMVQPMREEHLMRSTDSPRAWNEVALELSPSALAERRSHNQSTTIRVQDVAPFREQWYACSNQGLFVGNGSTWSHTTYFHPPAFQQTFCKFADFSRTICLLYNASNTGTRLHCMNASNPNDSSNEWPTADNGLIPPEAFTDRERMSLAGLGNVKATTELNGHFVLAQQQTPSRSPTLSGTFESSNPELGWTRVSALDGQTVVAMAHTTRAIFLLTRSGTSLTFWRFIEPTSTQ